MRRNRDSRSILRNVREAARSGFAWPGGYPLIVVMTDGATLCPACARAEYPLIARATRDGSRDGWAAAGTDIHWEGAPDECAHCGASIPSAYGED